MAAKQGNETAIKRLGLISIPTDKSLTLFKKYQEAAKAGDPASLYNLGALYAQGIGAKRSTIEALKLFRKAADMGFSKAQFDLGNAYAAGWGILPDVDEALKWYRMAALQGSSEAKIAIKKIMDLNPR